MNTCPPEEISAHAVIEPANSRFEAPTKLPSIDSPLSTSTGPKADTDDPKSDAFATCSLVNVVSPTTLRESPTVIPLPALIDFRASSAEVTIVEPPTEMSDPAVKEKPTEAIPPSTESPRIDTKLSMCNSSITDSPEPMKTVSITLIPPSR